MTVRTKEEEGTIGGENEEALAYIERGVES